jgi:hypothetical protein
LAVLIANLYDGAYVMVMRMMVHTVVMQMMVHT